MKLAFLCAIFGGMIGAGLQYLYDSRKAETLLEDCIEHSCCEPAEAMEHFQKMFKKRGIEI